MRLTLEEGVAQENGSSIELDRQLGTIPRSPEDLAKIVLQFAESEGWLHRVRLGAHDRWYERVYHGPDHDIWVISWMPGQSTGFHDHGESAGAFVLATGLLEEHRPGEQPLAIPPGQPRAFTAGYAHDVRNTSAAPAVSIHAYSPPLAAMNESQLEGSRLVPRDSSSERAEGLNQERASAAPTDVSSIDKKLAASRSLLRRLSPIEVREAMTESDAILIDIRPESQRAAEGEIPGALIVERNVLEWRLDPTSNARLPVATDHDLLVIVFCSEGYTSSLAAVALQDLGLWRATDMVGGFRAWLASGLPIVSQREPRD